MRYASRRGNREQAEEDEEATERLSSVIGDSGVGSAVARGPERYCSHLRRYQRGVRLARLVVCYLLNAVLLIVTTNACFSTEQREGQWFSMTTFVNRSCMVVGTLLPFVGSLLHNVGRDRPPRADTVHMQSVFVGYMVVVIAQSTAYRVQFNYDVEFHMALLSNTTLLTLHGALLLTTAVRRIARCNAPRVQSSQQQQQPSRLAYSQRPVNAAAANDALRSSRCDCKDTRAVFSAANGEDATLNDTATTFADSSPMSSIIVAATVSRDKTGSKRRTAEEPPPAARYDVHDTASPAAAAAAAATATAADVHVEDKENHVVVDAVDDQSSIPVTPYETLEKLATASLQPYLMVGERFRHDRSSSSDVTAVLIDAEALLREERNNVDRFRRCSGDYVPFDPLVNRSPSSRLDDATVRDDPGHSLLAGDAAREPTSFASELPTATPASSVVVPAVQPPHRRRRRYRLSCTVDPSTRHFSHRLTSTSSQRTYATTSESDADRCSTRCFAVSEATTTASKEATQSLPRCSLRFLREQSPQPDDRLAYETETVQRSQSQLLGRCSDFRPSRRQPQQQQQQQLSSQHHPYHHDPLETVLHEIEQAVDLINDLLDFTHCAAAGTASADHVPERPGDESARRCLYEYSPLSRFVEAVVQHCDDNDDDGDDGDEQNATGFGSKRVRRTVSRNNEADMSKIRDLYRRWVACVRRLAGDTARATVVEAALARDASLAAFRYARSGDSDYKRCFRGG